MTDSITFDNFLITHSKSVADDYADKTWAVKYEVEKKTLKADLPDEESQGFVRDFATTVAQYFDLLLILAYESPLLVFGTLGAIVLPLIFCCFWSITPSARPTIPVPVAAPSSDSSSSNIVEETVEEEEEEEPKKVSKVAKAKVEIEEEEEVKASPKTNKRRQKKVLDD